MGSLMRLNWQKLASLIQNSHFFMFCECVHYSQGITPIQIYWKFHHQNWKFSDKNSDIFIFLLKTQIVGIR